MDSRNISDDDIDALSAIGAAQQIAFAPVLFHAAASLRDLGILAFLDSRGKTGATAGEIAKACRIGAYGVGVLLDLACSAGVVLRKKSEGKFMLGKTGHFLLHDEMTRVNMDFVKDVCYAGMANLTEAIRTEKPAGLKAFGEKISAFPTIYPALSSLPEPAKTSWFAFDHFYSDSAFDSALTHVFKLSPKLIYDIGGNTGKFARRCVAKNPDVRVTVLDLPEQVALFKAAVAGSENAARLDAAGVNMLDDSALPGDADVWWMSQFLDCFSEEQITGILRRIRKHMKPGARVCVLEPFCDRQKFKAAEFSLNAGSLYFTCMANGNSRFYRAATMLNCVRNAGFELESEVNDVGVNGHSLLICR